MDGFKGFSPTPEPRRLPSLDDLLRIAAHAPPPPPGVAPPFAAVAQVEAPLVRVEKKLSEIRRIMKKGTPPKPFALATRKASSACNYDATCLR
jgi:hypothetical protein